MSKILLLVCILTLVLSCIGQISHESSLCKVCGQSRYLEGEGSNATETINATELSTWLVTFRKGQCRHQWVPISGYISAGEGTHWDGRSQWISCLRLIKELDHSSSEKITRERLDDYYRLLELSSVELKKLTMRLKHCENKQDLTIDLKKNGFVYAHLLGTFGLSQHKTIELTEKSQTAFFFHSQAGRGGTQYNVEIYLSDDEVVRSRQKL